MTRPTLDPLEAREKPTDLDWKAGKREIVSSAVPLHMQGGYYCDVCDCMIKDSQGFLNHKNGRRHQKNLGRSLKTRRTTLDEVRERLRAHAAKKSGPEADADAEGGEHPTEEDAPAGGAGALGGSRKRPRDESEEGADGQ